jgi:hypothetical protein
MVCVYNHSDYETTHYDAEIDSQLNSDVAYIRNSVMSHKFSTPHYFTNMQRDCL